MQIKIQYAPVNMFKIFSLSEKTLILCNKSKFCYYTILIILDITLLLLVEFKRINYPFFYCSVLFAFLLCLLFLYKRIVVCSQFIM